MIPGILYTKHSAGRRPQLGKKRLDKSFFDSDSDRREHGAILGGSREDLHVSQKVVPIFMEADLCLIMYFLL